jgi:hypothetical protein
MTMHVPPRYRLPIAVLASVGVVVVVIVAVLVANGGGPVVTPTPSTIAPASSDPTSTPEGAVRAFFEAFAQSRKTDDPTLIEPYVTNTDSSAYLTVAAFLKGQKEVGRASVTTVLRIENVTVEQGGTTATVSFDYTEGGYNIDPTTGSPVESPTILPTTHDVAVVRQLHGRWLVDSFQTR